MTWGQIGSDINGESTGDNSGRSVSLSDNGTIVAIGADRNNTETGHVRVYQYVDSNWVQLGDDINGESFYDHSGFSVDISADGKIVAVGAYANDRTINSSRTLQNSGHVRIYQYMNDKWLQLGNDIDGDNSADYLGRSLSLSDDGTIIAVGAYGNDNTATNAGKVCIYEYINNNWLQLGGDIVGINSYDYFGYSTSISSDGKILAIGAPNGDGNGTNSGQVKVYQYTNNNWLQLGDELNGEYAYDYSGYAIDISSKGNILAVGARRNDDSGANSGHVRVYQYINNNWFQLGNDIDGEAEGDYSGSSISLSDDGTTIAVSSDLNDGKAKDAGHVRIFQYHYIDNVWKQLGDDIDGEYENDFSGIAVSLEQSANDIYIAIGAHKNKGSFDRGQGEAGHVRVFLNQELNAPTEITMNMGEEESLGEAGDVSENLASVIRDYEGNPHGYLGHVPRDVIEGYKFQGQVDVNNDGIIEAIYTNRSSGRWVTASLDPITGKVDYSQYGEGGTTRVVGIYLDPLVQMGLMEKDSDYDSTKVFSDDLKLDNLILKTAGDYDSDGFQEVYWSKVDNTAYLRAVMHADGNIQYANYQNLDQMTDYLTSNGFADTVALIA